MSSSSTSNFTPESVSQVIQELRTQLHASNGQLQTYQAALQSTQQELHAVKGALSSMKQQLQNSKSTVKPSKPNIYQGKGSVLSWVTHMSNYLTQIDEKEGLSIAVSYLQGSGHEWWIAFANTDNGSKVTTWKDLKEALISRFDTIKKEKIARDKLARWKQIKDVSTFNDDFQRIMLEIPNISMEEQIDRYTRGSKAYIWRELCTNDYEKLSDAMRDAERIEAAHRRGGMNQKTIKTGSKTESSKPTPMEIGNIQLQKLSKEERDKCMKEGLCLRCRQKGHIAKNCPKSTQN